MLFVLEIGQFSLLELSCSVFAINSNHSSTPIRLITVRPIFQEAKLFAKIPTMAQYQVIVYKFPAKHTNY